MATIYSHGRIIIGKTVRGTLKKSEVVDVALMYSAKNSDVPIGNELSFLTLKENVSNLFRLYQLVIVRHIMRH